MPNRISQHILQQKQWLIVSTLYRTGWHASLWLIPGLFLLYNTLTTTLTKLLLWRPWSRGALHLLTTSLSFHHDLSIQHLFSILIPNSMSICSNRIVLLHGINVLNFIIPGIKVIFVLVIQIIQSE